MSRVFSEHGIYMLFIVLKATIATEVSIRIMDTFNGDRNKRVVQIIASNKLNNIKYLEYNSSNI